MCEIFPEVPNCCFLISLRMGMLFISIISIITGCITLSVIEQKFNASFNSLQNITLIAGVKKATDVVSHLSGLIHTTLTGMSIIYMFCGLVLLFATLSDQEGFAQVFVWLIFLCIIIGFFLVILIAVECLVKTNCVLSGMDWLSGSATLVLMVFYLIVWFYFVCVVNSYVLNG